MHNAHMIAHGFLGYGTHVAWLPPAPVPTPPPGIPHISVTTLLNLTMKAKYSPTELGMGGIPLVARGNDSQFFVPHFSIPMNNTLLPLTISLGGSKVMFGSSKVKINVGGAQDCGCCLPPFVPFSMNLACNDPCSYPSDYVIAPNTVEVGMTLGDVIGGVVSMAVDVAVSWAAGQLASGITRGVGGAIAGNILGREAGERAFYEAAGEFGENWIASAARETAQQQFAKEALEALDASLAGTYATAWVNELITKPLVGEGVNPLASGLLGGEPGTEGGTSDPVEAGQQLGHSGEDPGSSADPPIYDTSDPESNPNVNIDDDAW